MPDHERGHVPTVQRGDLTSASVLIATEEVVADVIGVLERGCSPFPRRPDLDAVSHASASRSAVNFVFGLGHAILS
jgi:hypothetical protein